MKKKSKHLEITHGLDVTWVHIDDAAKWLNRSPRTLERWIDGTQKRCCTAAEQILKLRGLGYLPLPGWSQYRIFDDVIYTPDDHPVERGNINAYYANLSLLSTLKLTVQELRDENKKLKNKIEKFEQRLESANDCKYDDEPPPLKVCLLNSIPQLVDAEE